MRTDLGWRLDPTVTFLNHGSYGACPEPVLAVQRAWRDRLEAEPVQFLTYDLPALLDEARRTVGGFLGADPAGLAFVPNATTGVNTVLQSLRFEPGRLTLSATGWTDAQVGQFRSLLGPGGWAVEMSEGRITLSRAKPGSRS